MDPWAGYTQKPRRAIAQSRPAQPPGEGVNRNFRVSHRTRLLRNHTRALWQKVCTLYEQATRENTIFDIQAFAEERLSYEGYMKAREEEKARS